MNDIHSHLESDKYSLYINNKKINVKLGGFPKIVTKIKTLQKEKNSLTINAGDLIQGTIYFTLFNGEATVKLFNQIKWDIFELGNHEFDEGDKVLFDILSNFKKEINIISANVMANKKSVLYNMWKPYVIKEIDNQKVAIIGIDIKNKTLLSSNPGKNIEFFDEFKTAQKYINRLLNQGINKIILVTHIGYKYDLKLASKLKGVDIIIGGDSHTLMGDFSSVGLKSVTKNYPKIIKNGDKKNVCITQAWSYGYVVGNFKAIFDENGDIKSCNGNQTLIISDEFESNEDKNEIYTLIKSVKNIEIIRDDKNSLKILNLYKSKLSKEKTRVVGKIGEYLAHTRVPYDTHYQKNILPHGSEVAPLVCKACLQKSKNSDFCILNAGAVRESVNKGYKYLTIINIIIQ